MTKKRPAAAQGSRTSKKPAAAEPGGVKRRPAAAGFPQLTNTAGPSWDDRCRAAALCPSVGYVETFSRELAQVLHVPKGPGSAHQTKARATLVDCQPFHGDDGHRMEVRFTMPQRFGHTAAYTVAMEHVESLVVVVPPLDGEVLSEDTAHAAAGAADGDVLSEDTPPAAAGAAAAPWQQQPPPPPPGPAAAGGAAVMLAD